MATIISRVPDTVEEFLAMLDDATLECRAQQHSWPLLKPGRNVKGIAVRAVVEGCYQVEFTCRNCGTVRVKTTLPRGEWDPAATYSYKHPAGYLAPKGVTVTRAEAMGELWRRMMERQAPAALAPAG